MDIIKTLTQYQDRSLLHTILESVEYRVARTKEEVEKAYHLVYKEYLKRGYVKKNLSQLRISLYNALPQTTTFVAVVEKEIVATTTVIPDTPLGLPMDSLYHKELNNLRSQKKTLCEISMLASNTEIFEKGISMMLNSKKLFFILFLFKTIFDYVKNYLKIDCICIAINPKHQATYDFLLFKDLGGLKIYHSVNKAPAIGKFLDLTKVEEECKKPNREGLYRMFFLKSTDPAKFSGKFIPTPQDLRYFFVEKTGIFKKIEPSALSYIKSCYPEYDFSQILDIK